jgi:hypothetical protein
LTVCSRCGKENQPHYKFCLGCGGDLDVAPASEAPEAEPAAEQDEHYTRPGQGPAYA